MQTLRFNTGRKYTAAGQRIVATLHADGVVTFFDHDRGIDGAFTLHAAPFDRVTVMHMYDHNIATSCARSWADGMQRGGCNSKWED